MVSSGGMTSQDFDRRDLHAFRSSLIGPAPVDWQGLYDALAHGEGTHRAWLRGMIQGWASAHEGRTVSIIERGTTE